MSGMNGIQIEHALDLIDDNLRSNMELVRPEVLDYLENHGNDLAKQISQRGYGIIPTQSGEVRITREDLEAVYA